MQDVVAVDQQQETVRRRAGAGSLHRSSIKGVGLERFRGQWIRMRFRLQVDRDEWSWPRLSFDLGTGDFDACTIPLPRATHGSPDISPIFLNVPPDCSLRAAASDRSSRKDQLGNATVQVIGKLLTITQMFTLSQP